MAALIVLLLFVLGASYALLRTLNRGLAQADRQQQTAAGLAAAKQALIAYAVSYPYAKSTPDLRNDDYGPGRLPCPDTGVDGIAESNCSTAGGTLLGRLPARTLDLNDVRDASGAGLWYALSENYRYGANQLEVINIETTGQLSVDAAGDVVAVLFAPGAALPAQNRATVAERVDPRNYLEGANADGDTLFSRSGNGEFNDTVEYITRAELMAAVQERVLSEVARVLEAHRKVYLAYPWFSPFADPTLLDATAGGSATDTWTDRLIDNRSGTGIFVARNVTADDIVYNLTDGSVWSITDRVNELRLDLANAVGGHDSRFDEHDRYVIRPRQMIPAVALKADAASSQTMLVDQEVDFKRIGVAFGDVIDNLTDNSAGMVTSVFGSVFHRLTVRRLTGGAANAFQVGNDYRIRSTIGTMGTVTDGTVLPDQSRNFAALGVRPGDVVENVETGVLGIAGDPATNGGDPATIKLVSLLGGSSIGAQGDRYRLSRFAARPDPVAGTHGLLPIHLPGHWFSTGFVADWSLPRPSGQWDVNPGDVTGPPAGPYQSHVQAAVAGSALSHAPITVARDAGACLWLSERFVDCRGRTARGDYLTGTAGGGSGGGTLVDADGVDFGAALHVSEGDRVIRKADNSIGYVTGVSGATLTVSDIALQPGDEYAIQLAARAFTGTFGAQFSTAGGTYSYIYPVVTLSPADVQGARICLEASNVCSTIAAAQTVSGTLAISLENGTSFEDGDPVVIRIYAVARSFEFRLRYSGKRRIYAVNQEKRRAVCRGYGTDCQGTPANVDIPVQYLAGEAPYESIVLTDYDKDDRVVGRAAVNVSATMPGRIRLAGIDMFLHAAEVSCALPDQLNAVVQAVSCAADTGAKDQAERDSDTAEREVSLPPWFIANQWHRYVYAAVARDHAPGGSGTCTPGTDCLVVEGVGAPNDDKQALVIGVGPEARNAGAAQDRTRAGIGDYLESGNDTPDDRTFTRDNPFDRLRIVSPAP
ncbi:MAG: hypothetical protein AB7Q97_18085 [Gammaproteobacteria bacterium]